MYRIAVVALSLLAFGALGCASNQKKEDTVVEQPKDPIEDEGGTDGGTEPDDPDRAAPEGEDETPATEEAAPEN